jgi:hypothetical protein
MAISRKPRPSSAETPSVDVDALINKGGSVSGDRPKSSANREKAASPVILRVPNSLLEQIDRVLEARPIKTPRHTWLLEAILEKLEKDAESAPL